ncbi:MAG: type II secretion system F family protein [Nanoarchaeota archaeon]|nr:type II secretion system F family protein [Nanoarchaeota archaeon]MBU4299971.1 type II secretion system F family protein [Nanoarchaeota archaeon]MBU4452587.1 type II secretion system F family protein [Nanoarchaeota archaeon]MCG2724067.1 type II secretion system F family protein [archaeon]
MYEKDARLKASKMFLKAGVALKPFFSHLKIYLMQVKSPHALEEHIAEALSSGTNMGMMAGAGLAVVGISSNNVQIIYIGIVMAPVLFLFSFYSSLYLPKVKGLKRAKEIERELPYALRHLLIEVKSGIPLYNGLVAISEKYGAASDEIRDIVEEINAGKSEIEAIEESIFKSPSYNFRRAFWQILNSLKTGTDIDASLSATVDDIIKQQLISIKKYGQELNPMTLMYMMVAIIIPSLGITFLIVLSMFAGGSIGSELLAAVIVGLAIFQAFFVNIIKDKRPNVKV